MARVDEDALPGADATLVYVAGNVREANRIEELLTQRGVDYSLSFEPFLRVGMLAAIVGPPEHVGVGFTVVSERADFSRGVLRERGFRVGIVEDDAP